MNRTKLNLIPFLLVLITVLSGCEVIGAIFKAGVWVGITIIIIVLIIIFWLIRKFSR